MSGIFEMEASVQPPPAPTSAAAATPVHRWRRGWGLLRALFARPGVIAVCDQGVVSAAGFATSVAIGRWCAPEELGVYYLGLSLLLFVRGVQEQAILLPYMVYGPRRRPGSLATYSGSILLAHAALGLLLMLGVAGLALWAWRQGGPSTWTAVAAVLAAAGPPLLLREFLRQFDFANLRTGSALLLDVAVAGLQLGGLGLLIVLGGMSAPAALAVMGASGAVAALGWFAVWRRDFQFAPRRAPGDWQRNWRFGRWSLAGQLAASGSTYVLPWLLTLWHGEAATGMLAASFTLVGLANMFVTGMSNYLTPKTAQAYVRRGAAELRRVVLSAAGLFLVVLGGFAFAVCLAGETVAVAIFKEKYVGAGPVMSLLAISLLATSLTHVFSNGLFALERPRLNSLADVLMTAVALAAAIAFIPAWGPLGAALATLCGAVAAAALRVLLFARLLKEAGSAEKARGGSAHG